MCRDRDHGGRRCPNDGATARRLRRVNAKKRSEHENNVSEPIEPKNIIIEPLDKTPAVKAQEILSEYREISGKNFVPKDNRDHFHHRHPLTEGEILAERKLIELGNAVEELAYTYGAPAQEDWEQLETNHKEMEDTMLRNHHDAYQKLLDMTGGEISENTKDRKPGNRYILYTLRGMKQSDGEYYYYSMKKRQYEKAGDVDKANRISDTLSLISKETEDCANLIKEQSEDIIARRSVAYKLALEELGVEFAGPDDFKFNATRNKAGIQMISEGSTYYPKKWVENSNTAGEVKVNFTKQDRSKYSNKDKSIKLNTSGDGLSVATHEIAHRIEHTNPEVGNAERAFLSRRSGLLAYHQKETQNYRGTVNRKEPTYADNFAVDYVGRAYDADYTYSPRNGYDKGTPSYEVLSMGMEAVFFGNHGAGVGINGHKKDNEHNHFVLGLLATAAK